MSNANLLKQLGVDQNLNPLPIDVKLQPDGKYYKATFDPDFPPIPSFKPNRFFYASLTDDSVSAIGRYSTNDDFYQITIVLKRELESGEYTIEKSDESPVRASVMAAGRIISGDKGKIKLERDDTKESIYAEFDFQIESGGKPYTVKGKLDLLASGPLDKSAQ